MPADSLRGLHLVVSDIDKARAVLIDRGAEVGPVEDLGGVFYATGALTTPVRMAAPSHGGP
jgi:hypothetical protein